MDLLHATVEAVLRAAELVRSKLSQVSIVDRKGSANFVTQVDYEVQHFLVDQLRGIEPEATIVAEESENQSYDSDKPLWLLDPVDGTTNLLHKNPYLSISVAFCVGGNRRLGIVHNPLTREMFTATANGGAFLNGSRISVSSHTKLCDAIISMGFPYDRSRYGDVFGAARRILTNCQDLRRCGCASLDLAYVACGRTDGHFDLDLHPWDYSAGLIILEEAGGEVTDWAGQPPILGAVTNVLASNGRIHEQLLQHLKG